MLSALLLAACGSGGTALTAAPSPNPVEADLLFGVRRDAAVDCTPEREGLPAGALGAVTCLPMNGLITRFTLVRWETEEALLAAYFGALAEHGVAPRSGDCFSGGESAYWPGDDVGLQVTGRQGCFSAGDERVILMTMPPTVLAEIHGVPSPDDPGAFEIWPWRGNQDAPGGPTVFGEDGPLNFEK